MGSQLSRTWERQAVKSLSMLHDKRCAENIMQR